MSKSSGYKERIGPWKVAAAAAAAVALGAIGVAIAVFPWQPSGKAPAANPAPPTPPSPAPEAPAPGREVRLLAVGDLMLARGVETMISRHGLDYPLELVASRLAAADLTVANLESPLGTKGRPLPGKLIWFRARPEAVQILKQGGIDAVTLANNHILDYDTENFLETLDLLGNNGIAFFGGGRNIDEARRPLVLERKGLRIAFLGYSQFADLFFAYSYPRRFEATDKLPGIAPMQDALIFSDIKRARQQADLVVVAYHWGEEYHNMPTPEQVRLGRASIDAGATLVLGFHPHAIQGLERYKGGLIAYSLGNFVMDQQDPVTRESMILEVTLSPQGIEDVQVTPVEIDGRRPKVLQGEEKEALAKKIARLSEQIH